ncbi:hypothetical protein EfmAA818_14390 [Enterococcus faecium]|nr:hypothetical protein EfmAA818_14390 [Enterococcus faecium]
MTYTHLTPNELVMIEAYFHQETPVAIVAKQLKRGRQTIYNVYNFLKCGGTAHPRRHYWPCRANLLLFSKYPLSPV